MNISATVEHQVFTQYHTADIIEDSEEDVAINNIKQVKEHMQTLEKKLDPHEESPRKFLCNN